MHNLHIEHLGAHSIMGTIINDIFNDKHDKDYTKGDTLDDVVHVTFDTISTGISLHAQALDAASRVDTHVVVARHGDKPDLYVHPYQIHVDGLYATFHAGHEIALLQKEADVFTVRQGKTFEDEVYIDFKLTANRVEREEKDKFDLISGNLGLEVQEGHPRPLDDRHVNLCFVSDFAFEHRMEDAIRARAAA